MSICGRSTWCGKDPRVVRLTDDGVRKVQVTLESVRGKHRFTLDVIVENVDGLISELELARTWVTEDPR